MRRLTAALCVAFTVASLGLVACAREEVEVAELDPSDAAVPDLAHDAGLDGATCGLPPAVGFCGPCPHGYRGTSDGGASCECCP